VDPLDRPARRRGKGVNPERVDGMNSPFEITGKEIGRLDSLQLTALLRGLLHLEAKRFLISPSGISVNLSITIPDGGEDGRIEWSDGPQRTDYIPTRLTLFQVKAQDTGPTDCTKELAKPRPRETLNNSGGVVIFCNRPYSAPLIERRRKALAQAACGFGCDLNICSIDFFDANKISDWVNCYFSAAIFVMEQLGGAPVGVQTWSHWNRYADFQRYKFVPDQDVSAKLEQLRSSFTKGFGTVARLVGASGLGKTRLALEAFRPPDSGTPDPQPAARSDSVVYYADGSRPNILEQVIDWRTRGAEALLVVDDCSAEQHQRLAKEGRHRDSKLNILTLDYYPVENTTDPVMELNPASDSVVKGILEQAYGVLSAQDSARIIPFAQGFPQMAVLLADARLAEDPQWSSLQDDELLKRLLWGHGSPDQNALEAVRACALFERLGFDGTIVAERHFVAKEICCFCADPSKHKSDDHCEACSEQKALGGRKLEASPASSNRAIRGYLSGDLA
jgi:hypothetical protein